MDWKHWVIFGLVIFTAGWILFDGIRAMIVGDYVTPKTGEYAAQLGPWSNLVKAVGIVVFAIWYCCKCGCFDFVIYH